MAAGDFIVFDSFIEAMGDGNIPDLNTLAIHMAICTNATVPTKTSVDPRYGAGGTTNFLATDIGTGGNYTAGGPELTVTITVPWTISGSTGTFDLDDVSIDQDGANPDTGYWGIIYMNDADDRCIGFCELGSPVLLSAGNFTITWNASGLFTINNP
jgi:hypothetical protein